MSQSGTLPCTQSHGQFLRACLSKTGIPASGPGHISFVEVPRDHARSSLTAHLMRRSRGSIQGPPTTGTHPQASLQLYRQRLEEGLTVSTYIFVRVLKSCASLADLNHGKQVHAEIISKGFELDLFVGTALVDMYLKCGCMEDARLMFERLSNRDAVSWNAMIAGYVQQDQGEMAWNLYLQMREDGVNPHDRTLISLLKACGCLAGSEKPTFVNGMLVKTESLQKGHSIYAEILKRGYESDVFVATTLVDMYVKCGSVVDACRVFHALPFRDSVSWNAIIGGHVQLEQGEKALWLYEQMLLEAVSPHLGVLSNILKACGSLAKTEEGSVVNYRCVKLNSLYRSKIIHAAAVRKGYDLEISLATTLVVTYAKCGSLDDARKVFDAMLTRDVTLWNAMILAYSLQDEGELGLQLYADMEEQGVRPDPATFLSVLKACSLTGSLKMCHHIQRDIGQALMHLNEKLMSSLIDTFGKCGSMLDAQHVFDGLPRHDVVSWTALIAGYARNGQIALSISLFLTMQEESVRPVEATYLCILNACNHAGMVNKGLEFFQSMCRDGTITPRAPHYSSVIDLLSRAGLFNEVNDLLLAMPVLPDLSVWISVMSACRTHYNLELGIRAFNCAVSLAPKHCAPYMLMSNMFAQACMWEHAKDIEIMRITAGAWKTPCYSFTEWHGRRDTFTVDDAQHPEIQHIYGFLDQLNAHMSSKNA